MSFGSSVLFDLALKGDYPNRGRASRGIGSPIPGLRRAIAGARAAAERARKAPFDGASDAEIATFARGRFGRDMDQVRAEAMVTYRLGTGAA